MAQLQKQVDKWIEEYSNQTPLSEILQKVSPQSCINESIKLYLETSKEKVE